MFDEVKDTDSKGKRSSQLCRFEIPGRITMALACYSFCIDYFCVSEQKGWHMSFTQRVEFGNYTLKFGDEKVLLDYFNEIVVPSFKGHRYVRKIKGKGEYFFWTQKSFDYG